MRSRSRASPCCASPRAGPAPRRRRSAGSRPRPRRPGAPRLLPACVGSARGRRAARPRAPRAGSSRSRSPREGGTPGDGRPCARCRRPRGRRRARCARLAAASRASVVAGRRALRGGTGPGARRARLPVPRRRGHQPRSSSRPLARPMSALGAAPTTFCPPVDYLLVRLRSADDLRLSAAGRRVARGYCRAGRARSAARRRRRRGGRGVAGRLHVDELLYLRRCRDRRPRLARGPRSPSAPGS